MRLLSGLACLIFGLLAASAQAQVALDRFQPAALPSDGFAVSRPDVLPARAWLLSIAIDYANDPFVLNFSRPARELSVVSDQLVIHPGAALGVRSWLTLFATLPIHALMRGHDPVGYGEPPDGAGVGDLALGARALIAGGNARRATLSAELIARAPTAELANQRQVYSGDRVGSYEPALIGELHLGRFDLRLRAGARFRQEIRVGDLDLGQDLVGGLGARFRVQRELSLHAELFGSLNLTKPGNPEHAPLELLAGPKVQISDWTLGVAAGPGLIRGYGSPDVRVAAMASYAPTAQKKSPPTAAKPLPESMPEPAPRDTDGDGIFDLTDHCPTQPEDKDGFVDQDGCVDPDDDKDGLLDASDGCRLEPEDVDDFEDEDGCPDRDNDQDGLLDVSDECALHAEDKDTYKDLDGCPDPDNDRDSVLDIDDACPLEAGAADLQGCPKAVRLDMAKGQLMILRPVEFATGKDLILVSSEPLLEEVGATLAANPQIKAVRVEGHTDDVGSDEHNIDLSRRRARSVARWLVSHGIAAERLQAWGCGETHPLHISDSTEARQKNRRVEFHVTDPAPATPRDLTGCVQLPLR